MSKRAFFSFVIVNFVFAVISPDFPFGFSEITEGTRR
jgi:hypothetical protein